MGRILIFDFRIRVLANKYKLERYNKTDFECYGRRLRPLSKITMNRPTTAMTPRIIRATVKGFISIPPFHQGDNPRALEEIL
jgi:hypothetical protein